MGAIISSIRARFEVAEALLRGELSGEEAQVLRAKVLKRSRRGRMLLRIERIERAMHKLQPQRQRVCLPWELNERSTDMNERRAQDDTARLARAVLEHQLELIRESFVRRGKSEWVANDIVSTTIEEFRDGDPGLLEIFREKSLN